MSSAVSVKRFTDDAAIVTANVKREAKYLHAMGRHPKWYASKHGAVLISDWVDGFALEDKKGNPARDFAAIPVETRFKWLVSVFADLNFLHARFRVHGDIKPENCVASEEEMRLIDFGSTHKVASAKEFAWTVLYVHGSEGFANMLSGDMFSMGYIIARIFPDLFAINKPEGVLMVMGGVIVCVGGDSSYKLKKLEEMNLSPLAKAIYNLVDALMEINPQDRCTSLQAMEYCAEIHSALQCKKSLDEQTRIDITNRTINRGTLTVEDALRDCRRPANFLLNAIVAPDVDKTAEIQKDSIISEINERIIAACLIKAVFQAISIFCHIFQY